MKTTAGSIYDKLLEATPSQIPPIPPAIKEDVFNNPRKIKDPFVPTDDCGTCPEGPNFNAIPADLDYTKIFSNVDPPPDDKQNWKGCAKYVWGCTCLGTDICSKLPLPYGETEDHTDLITDSMATGDAGDQFVFKIEFVGFRKTNPPGTFPRHYDYEPSTSRYKISRATLPNQNI